MHKREYIINGRKAVVVWRSRGHLPEKHLNARIHYALQQLTGEENPTYEAQ